MKTTWILAIIAISLVACNKDNETVNLDNAIINNLHKGEKMAGVNVSRNTDGGFSWTPVVRPMTDSDIAEVYTFIIQRTTPSGGVEKGTVVIREIK